MNICPKSNIKFINKFLKRDEYEHKSNYIFSMYMFFIYFWMPISKILKLVLNSILGGITIYLINWIGGMVGFHIGLNIFTSVLIGILGLPGTVCLVIVKLLIS